MKALNVASMSAEASVLKRPEQWRAYREISDRAQFAQDRAERLYQKTCEHRIEKELNRRLNERVKTAPVLKPRYVVSEHATVSQVRVAATRTVELRHEMRKLRINRAEEKLKFDLLYGRPCADHGPHNRSTRTR